MFMGPLQAVKPWSTKGVEGVHRFLKRANRLVTETPLQSRAMTKAEAKSLNAMIKKVGDDLEAMAFNTAISAMMVFINEAEDFAESGGLPKEYTSSSSSALRRLLRISVKSFGSSLAGRRRFLMSRGQFMILPLLWRMRSKFPSR